MMRTRLLSHCLLALALGFRIFAPGAAIDPAVRVRLDACNVAWTVPGPTSSESMPLGNGEIGLNVWAETNGR
jgi:alpha-L-fucosidase 2